MMMVWASRTAIREKVADVPENWLRAFAVRHPTDFRKFHESRNGSALYRVEAVLKAIEDGEGMPNDGIKDIPFDIESLAVAEDQGGCSDTNPSARTATRATIRPDLSDCKSQIADHKLTREVA